MQSVSFGDASSDYRNITCGVPQGSILGPLLFLLYINDMHNAVKFSTLHHFAYDTNLLYSNKDINVLRKNMNKDLKFIFEWLCANRLSLNASKTEFIIFRPPNLGFVDSITLSLNQTKIYESAKIKYLGIILDSRLSWKFHIFELRKKLNRAVGVLYRLSKLKCQKNILLSIYYALFHSHLSYGLCVWGHADERYTDRLELAKKRAVRVISGAEFLAPTKQLFSDLKLLNVDQLFSHQYACLMWDFKHNMLPKCFDHYFTSVQEVHSHYTRRAKNDMLVEVGFRTVHGKSQFKYFGPKIHNLINELNFFCEQKSKSFQPERLNCL